MMGICHSAACCIASSAWRRPEVIVALQHPDQSQGANGTDDASKPKGRQTAQRGTPISKHKRKPAPEGHKHRENGRDGYPPKAAVAHSWRIVRGAMPIYAGLASLV